MINMKRFFYLFLFLSVLLCNSVVYSQNNTLKKITQNGVEFYLYEVAEGEGLYKISNTFNISQEEIMQYNPQAVSGITQGMTLRIPVSSTRQTSTTDFVTHKVEKGQTMYFLTRRYQITEATLLQYNPSIANGIKEGDILKIPVVSTVTPPLKSISLSEQSKSDKEHMVESKETLYSISKAYGVTVEDLVQYNPGIEQGLKVGQQIKIPPANAVIKNTATSVISAPKPLERAVKVALLLPFMLDNEEKQDATIDKFIEFYEGFLLGVNTLKAEGVSVELFTYDIEKSDTKIKEVLQTPEIRKADLIVGPAYSVQLNAVSNFAMQNSIPTVIPFAPKVDAIKTNPFLFQNNCPEATQYVIASNIFVNKFSEKNIIIVNFKNEPVVADKGIDFVKELKQTLESKGISYREFTASTNTSVEIEARLAKNEETIVVFGTENGNLVNSILPEITSLSTDQTPISVFGFDEWGDKIIRSYRSVYYYSQFFINKNTPESLSYRDLFRKEFGYVTNSLPRYDLMGYDLSTYFIKAVNLYGKRFPDMLQTGYKQENPLQSKFLFRKTGKGGYINNTMLFLHSVDGKEAELVE